MKKLLAVFLIILALPFGALAAGDADPLLQRAQSVLDALTNGRYSEISSQFDETMRAAVSEEAIAQGWEAILAQYGGYVGVETTQASSENRSVALTLAHENGSVMMTVSFNGQFLISGLLLRPASTTVAPVEKALPEGAAELETSLFPGSGRELRASVVLPAGHSASTPCVVLVQGSGASDMDETIGPNKPFRDLAYGLAGLGMASLRFDKISYAHPELPIETVNQEYLEPVAEALRVAAEQTGSSSIYVAGHSQGGILTPWLVDECGFTGGIVLAGTPSPLWKMSYDQNLQVIASMPEDQRGALLAQVESERERAETIVRLTDEEARQQTAFGMNALYLKSMDVLDQAAIAAQTEKPFLFLWGESDFQVSRTAFDGWRQALGDGSRYTYLTYAGLNHLFMPAQEGDSLMNVQEAYARPAQVDSAVAADIAAWLAARQP